MASEKPDAARLKTFETALQGCPTMVAVDKVLETEDKALPSGAPEKAAYRCLAYVRKEEIRLQEEIRQIDAAPKAPPAADWIPEAEKMRKELKVGALRRARLVRSALLQGETKIPTFNDATDYLAYARRLEQLAEPIEAKDEAGDPALAPFLTMKSKGMVSKLGPLDNGLITKKNPGFGGIPGLVGKGPGGLHGFDFGGRLRDDRPAFSAARTVKTAEELAETLREAPTPEKMRRAESLLKLMSDPEFARLYAREGDGAGDEKGEVDDELRVLNRITDRALRREIVGLLAAAEKIFPDLRRAEIIAKLYEMKTHEKLLPERREVDPVEARKKLARVTSALLAAYDSDGVRRKRFEFALSAAERPAESAQMDDFLKGIGVDPELRKAPFPDSIDLSSKLPRPQCQGDSKACVGFAFAYDLSAAMDSKTGDSLPPLDPWYTYMLLTPTGDPLRDREADARIADTGSRDYAQMLRHIDAGVPLDFAFDWLKHEPTVPDRAFDGGRHSFVPESLNAVPDRRYLIDSYRTTEARPAPRDLMAILRSGKPFMVGIKSDARFDSEEWIRPEPVGSIPHIFELVGTGFAVNPFTHQTERYYKIFDPLGKHPIPHKVAEMDLIPAIFGLYKITGAKVLEQPKEYPK